MKTLSLLLLCCISAYGQQSELDSLKEKILKMDAAINTIHLNMVRSHNEFKTGTFLIIGGTALIVAGVLIRKDKDGEVVRESNNALVHIGAGVTTIGTIIQIDSHRWLGRGGRKKRK